MNESELDAGDWMGVEWTDWTSLDPTVGDISSISTDEGIYRVRHRHREGLAYIGETGRSLRGRVRALARGVYADAMPYRDPHTAAPCLWAIRQENGPELEVSVAMPSLVTDKQQRKAFEAALIAVHRRETGMSPTANFGRIIPGYTQSSYRRDEIRGGLLVEDEVESNAKPGIGPLPWTNRTELVASDWMGLSWSSPRSLAAMDSSVPSDNGLYRLWRAGAVPPLEYIGQSANLRSRLRRHRTRRDGELLVSYTTLLEHNARHKREEVETELIGVHWLVTEASPRDQF